MPENETAQAFADWLSQRVGDDLRAVAAYGPVDYEFVHVRADLRAGFERADVGEVIESLRAVQRAMGELPAKGAETGVPLASVQTFEETLVIQLLLGEEEAVIASFEPAVGRNLLAFIGECRDRLVHIRSD